MSSNRVFVVAEMGSNWRFGDELANAYRGIAAAKACDADAFKVQWVSDYRELMKRRNAPDSEEWAYKYVPFPQDWLPLLKAECDRVGIEFMVTAYLHEDVAVLAPFVSRFKVAAKEREDHLLFMHMAPYKKPIISSMGGVDFGGNFSVDISYLWCVSKYPTPIDEIAVGAMFGEPVQGRGHYRQWDGLSDHTAHVLTGAVAVGAGARIIESHVRLHDTPRECPDYGHSLVLPTDEPVRDITGWYARYVHNIRTASRML